MFNCTGISKLPSLGQSKTATEFEYLIRDRELEARTLTELAFEHLGRLLVVDEDTKAKWSKAFDSHET